MKKVYVLLWCLVCLLASIALSSANEFNLPPYWLKASNGTRLDANNNGIIDYTEDSALFGGQLPTYYVSLTQFLANNASIWTGINSKLPTSTFLAENTSIWNAVNARFLTTTYVSENASQWAAINNISANVTGNYYTKTESNNLFYNKTTSDALYYNKSVSDGKYTLITTTAEVNSTLWNAVNSKFPTAVYVNENITVWAAINNISDNLSVDFANYYNVTTINLLFYNKTTSDTRYALITSLDAVNASLQTEISLQAANNLTQAGLISALDTREAANNNTQNVLLLTKLNVSDQRFNDSDAISLKVPYNGANASVNLNAKNLSNVSVLTLSNGQPVSWNVDAYTLDIPTGLGNTYQVGQELTLIRKNQAGRIIYAGTVVFDSGSQGDVVTIGVADAANGSTLHNLGMVTIPSCANNAACPVTYFGDVHDLDTSDFAEGASLWLKDDGSGNVTDTPPTGASSYHYHIGTVARNHSTVGIVDFQPHIDYSDQPVFYAAKILNNITSPLFLENGVGLNNLYNDSRLVSGLNSTFYNQTIATRDPTGFRDHTTSTLVYNANNNTFMLSGAYPIYINGYVSNRQNDSIVVTNSSGMHFIYYDDFSGLKQSTTPWEFESIVQVATVYVSGIKGAVGDERHGIGMDWRTHEYLHETIGTRYATGLAATFNNTGFTVGTGEFYDEDIEYEVTSVLNTCDLFYHRNSTSLTWLDDQTQYFYKNATNMYYDNLTGLSAVGNNQFMAVWIFATNDIDSTILCMLGQRTDATIGAARTNNLYESLSFGTLPVPEMKLLYRVIVDNDVSPYVEALDYRAVSTVSGSSYVATDHGTLTGLSDDDHTIYLLRTDFATENTTKNSQISTVDTRVSAVNTTANLNSLGYNTTTELGGLFAETAGANTWTGANVFNPTSNTSFYNDALFYGATYFLNNVTLTSANGMSVNNSILLKNIAGTVIGNWSDTGGLARLYNNGNLTNTGYFTTESAKVTQTGTTGNALWAYRNLASTDTDDSVAFIEQDNAGDDQEGLIVQQDGAGQGIYVISTNTGISLNIDDRATGHGMVLESNKEKSAGRYSLYVTNTNTTNSQSLVYLNNDGSGSGLVVDGAGTGYSAIFNNGNVGIGTTTPAQTLSVVGTGNFTGVVYVGSGGTLSVDSNTKLKDTAYGGWQIGRPTGTYDMSFSTNGSSSTPIERMRITSTGLVGIGATAPERQLTLYAASPQIKLESSGTGIAYLTYQSNNSYPFQIYNDQTDSTALTISNISNVGIGTTAPNEKLAIVGNMSVTTIYENGASLNSLYNQTSTIATLDAREAANNLTQASQISALDIREAANNVTQNGILATKAPLANPTFTANITVTNWVKMGTWVQCVNSTGTFGIVNSTYAETWCRT